MAFSVIASSCGKKLMENNSSPMQAEHKGLRLSNGNLVTPPGGRPQTAEKLAEVTGSGKWVVEKSHIHKYPWAFATITQIRTQHLLALSSSLSHMYTHVLTNFLLSSLSYYML